MEDGEHIIDEETGLAKCNQCPFVQIDEDVPSEFEPEDISFIKAVEKVSTTLHFLIRYVFI